VFLSAFTFRANHAAGRATLVEQYPVLNRIQTKVPENAPVDFVPAEWRPYVIGKDGKIDQHYYEILCAVETAGPERATFGWKAPVAAYA